MFIILGGTLQEAVFPPHVDFKRDKEINRRFHLCLFNEDTYLKGWFTQMTKTWGYFHNWVAWVSCLTRVSGDQNECYAMRENDILSCLPLMLSSHGDHFGFIWPDFFHHPNMMEVNRIPSWCSQHCKIIFKESDWGPLFHLSPIVSCYLSTGAA